MIIAGDFNVDVSRNRSLQDFMQHEFNLTYVQTTAITLGNTCVDLTFAINLNVSCLPFVSYFSYNRPMINLFSFIYTSQNIYSTVVTYWRKILRPYSDTATPGFLITKYDDGLDLFPERDNVMQIEIV
jgi:hypothetical protein